MFSSKKDEKLIELYNKEDEEQEGEEDEEEEVVQLVLPLAKPKDKRKKKNEELGSELLFDERDKNIRDIMGPMGKLHNNVVHIRKSANRTT